MELMPAGSLVSFSRAEQKLRNDMVSTEFLQDFSVVPECEVTHTQLPTFPGLDLEKIQQAGELMERPEPAKSFNSIYANLAKTYGKVRQVGTPNYRGARVPLKHNLNIPAWWKYM